MKSIGEKILLKSPVMLQNIILSLYGLRVLNVRYAGNYNKYKQQYTRRLKYSRKEVSAYQNQELASILKYSVMNIPYYKDVFSKNNFDVTHVKTVEDLKCLPLLEKDTLRKIPQQFVNESQKKVLTLHTTGTTGTPLRIYCNNYDRQRNYAYFDRWLESLGIGASGKRATIGGRIIVPQKQDKPPFWRYSYFQKNMLYSSYHLTDENMGSYIDALRKYSPGYIDTYPSSIYSIAEFAMRNGINLKGITNYIVTSAETLFSYMRSTIESAFEAKIYDQYGAAEMCVFVGQCKNGRYHIHDDYGIVEFIADNGAPAKPGEEAEIVCTGFVNKTMPLIRYRIGDRGVLSDEKCECGLPFPVMEKIIGRMDDVIITPDGKKVGRLSPVLKGFPIKEAQYVQEDINVLKVLIVKGETYSEKTQKDVEQELRKRVGNAIQVEFKYVDHIIRGKGGKLKSIVSRISNEP
jgi:phenylacetate-CoA ligase